MVIHDNTYTGGVTQGMELEAYRSADIFPIGFGGATGINPWDVNDPHGAYVTGSQTGSTSTGTLTDSSQNGLWTANRWVGYTIYNTVTGQMGYIKSNTANPFTCTYTVTGIMTPLTMNTGNGYHIYKVLTLIDQPGRGQGDLLAFVPAIGGVRVNTNQGNVVAWPRQALEPVYSWNNTLNGNNVNITAHYANDQEGRDFYNNTPMPGYTPYTYPHPLVSGAPAAPQGLHVVQ